MPNGGEPTGPTAFADLSYTPVRKRGPMAPPLGRCFSPVVAGESLDGRARSGQSRLRPASGTPPAFRGASSKLRHSARTDPLHPCGYVPIPLALVRHSFY